MPSPLSAFGLTTPCPVQRQRRCYAISSTEPAYGTSLSARDGKLVNTLVQTPLSAYAVLTLLSLPSAYALAMR
eukprot:2063889-Rhodomonas_salina.7